MEMPRMTFYRPYKQKGCLATAFRCDSHRIQTCNLLIRSQMLYSVELANLLVCDPSQNHDAKLVLFFELCKFSGNFLQNKIQQSAFSP